MSEFDVALPILAPQGQQINAVRIVRRNILNDSSFLHRLKAQPLSCSTG